MKVCQAVYIFESILIDDSLTDQEMSNENAEKEKEDVGTQLSDAKEPEDDASGNESTTMSTADNTTITGMSSLLTEIQAQRIRVPSSRFTLTRIIIPGVCCEFIGNNNSTDIKGLITESR